MRGEAAEAIVLGEDTSFSKFKVNNARAWLR